LNESMENTQIAGKRGREKKEVGRGVVGMSQGLAGFALGNRKGGGGKRRPC